MTIYQCPVGVLIWGRLTISMLRSKTNLLMVLVSRTCCCLSLNISQHSLYRKDTDKIQLELLNAVRHMSTFMTACKVDLLQYQKYSSRWNMQGDYRNSRHRHRDTNSLKHSHHIGLDLVAFYVPANTV